VELGLRKSFKIVAPGRSLRRRVGYSLAIVRLILVPVIFLAVYSLYAMGLIVDRIVSADAPVARLAERASVEMLDARRAERNYFLLRDPQYLKTNQRWYTYTGTRRNRWRGGAGSRCMIPKCCHLFWSVGKHQSRQVNRSIWFFHGIIEEFHTCPKCGGGASRHASYRS
jgi:hypothetical protein